MSKPDDKTATWKPKQIEPGELLDRLFHMPLYERVDLSGSEDDANSVIRAMRLNVFKFDAYCPACSRSTTWVAVVDKELERRSMIERATPVEGAPSGRPAPMYRPSSYLEDFTIRLICSRDQLHQAKLYFSFEGPSPMESLSEQLGAATAVRVTPWVVIKVGQWPSLTDFQRGDLSEFEDGMTKQQRNEFVRAINCTAHGFNVAACVYYRRVFESVLLGARDQYMLQNGMNDWPEFNNGRMDEKIRLLRDHLPKFMSEHPQLYAVLSIGVHELTEEKCAAELPMLRKAIELIVRDRMTAASAKKERDDLSKLVAQSVDRHKNSSN